MQVVQQCIEQIGAALEIAAAECDELTMFFVIESEKRYCPLSRDEYLLDVVHKLRDMHVNFYLLCQRTSWVYPIDPRGGLLYTEMMYTQVEWQSFQHM